MLITVLAGASCGNQNARASFSRPIILCSTPQTDTLTIHKFQPFIRQSFNPRLQTTSFEVLVVSINSVENPDLEPLSFTVNVELPNQTLQIGALSLYPPDEPGIFRFRIDDYKADFGLWGNGSLIIKLEPVPDAPITDKVKVVFGATRWE